ncbi:MAG: leucine-rich repeat domain-containing protein, partial [Ruminococcus sp.]|nr:leucine-rich repeat domain-containing protein [Ruminococcus sp.]
TNLTTISTPKLTTMGAYSFAYCSKLTNIYLEDSTIKSIPNYAFAYMGSTGGKKSLTVKLPSTVQRIGNHAFYDAQRLEFINLSNVTYIAPMAFTYCWKLKTVLTSDNLSSIGADAFNCCDSLEFFVCKNKNVTIGSRAFGYRQNSKGTKIVLWGSNGGGNVKTYAANNGLTYKNTEDAAKEAVKNFEPYVWTCGNSPTIFGVKDEKTQNVVRFFTDDHKAYVDDYLEVKGASGSCYGMAAISSLIYNGHLYVDEFAEDKNGKTYNTISAIDDNVSDFTRSFINTVWANNRLNYDYKLFGQTGSSKFDVNGKDAEILKYMEYITYGADVAAVAYRYFGVNHAIVCLGMEFYDNASDKSNSRWKNGTMDARILLYDVNKNKFSNNYCMYVDFETGKWTMDYDYQTTFSSDKNNNFEFELYYKPDSILANGSLKGLDLIEELIYG